MLSALLVRLLNCCVYTGQPLTDEDRWPWLDKIAIDLNNWGVSGESAVVACSALKRSYRDRLRDGASSGDSVIQFVHLRLNIPKNEIYPSLKIEQNKT